MNVSHNNNNNVYLNVEIALVIIFYSETIINVLKIKSRVNFQIVNNFRSNKNHKKYI